jgi:outer membrane protein TolC
LPETIPLPSADSTVELSLEQLVADVLARNPNLQAMTATWQAATWRYPQAIALDDPMFNSTMAPKSFNSATVEGAYALQASQKLPWFGKRDARGRQAQSEATAAFQDIGAARVQLAEATKSAFLDYYLVRQELRLNALNLKAVQQFRRAASAKYESNQVTQQDVLQADLEIADLSRREIELRKMDRVAVARINTLLVQSPSEALPEPPTNLGGATEVPPLEQLHAVALQQRPDLQALGAKSQAAKAAIDKANLDYRPDVEVYGRYDTFWQPAATQGDLRGQVGVNMNMPIYRAKRDAAVREAEATLCQRRAEFDQRVQDIQFEVQSAFEELQEAAAAVQLYSEKILPAAKQNLAAANANYDSAKSDFLVLLTAQRQLIAAQEKQQQALTDYHRRRALLERAIGGPQP